MLLTLALAADGYGQDKKPAYPAMAPFEQVPEWRTGTPRFGLARSAAPPSISADADVLVLGSRGYEPAVKGTNGFVCFVERSWTAGFEDREFWNSRLRARTASTHRPCAASSRSTWRVPNGSRLVPRGNKSSSGHAPRSRSTDLRPPTRAH